MENKDIRELQKVLIEMIDFIDKICKENGIIYYLYSGTALGAIRHKGFIPWDDDLDIIMTPENFEKFKKVFEKKNNYYFLQEWNIAGSEFIEYAKLRKNNTTFIEKQFMNRKDLHQGIFVDIFILHKCPNDIKTQKILYNMAHFVIGMGLSERGWKPKTIVQKIAFLVYRILPKRFVANKLLKKIYSYNDLKENYKYNMFMDRVPFKKALLEPEQVENVTENEFEGLKLYGFKDMDGYLKQIFGDYMKLPSEEQRKKDIHAEIWDTEKNYNEYI